MATKATIIGKVGRMVRTDTPIIVSGDIDPYLADALARYNRDRPYETVVDATGSAAKLQATPTGWVQGFSAIRKIAYPYEDENSTTLEQDEYTIDTVPVSGVPTDKLRFYGHEPAATETVRVWFTVPHTLSDSSCTIYTADVDPFCHLVAAMIETAKASYFLGLRSQSIEADLVDYGAKANEARALAKMHFEAYQRGLGLATEDAPVRAAAVALDVDVEPQHPYAPAQRHHGRRFR